VRGLVPGFCVLGVTLLVATLIGADRFRWDYSLTWMWTAVYAALPPTAVYLWLRQGRLGPEVHSGPDRELGALRLPALVLGAAMTVLGVALFVAPDRLLEDWPWPITPLIARVLSGWYLLSAVTLLYSQRFARRAHELPIPYATVAVWSLLTLLVLPLYPESAHRDATGYWPFIALHALVLSFCAAAVVRSLGLMRATSQRL